MYKQGVLILFNSFFTILIFGSSICYSQNWILKFKPMLSSSILSFQKFQGITYDQQISGWNGYQPQGSSLNGNMFLNTSFCSDIYMEFYKINDKINLGGGIGLYTGGGVFLRAAHTQMNSIYTNADFIYTGNASKSGSSYSGSIHINYYVASTFRTSWMVNSNKQNISWLTFGFGIAHNNMLDGFSTNDSGRFDYVTFKNHAYLPFLLFRFEYEFRGKKGKNICNIFLNYQQGIFKAATLTHTDTKNLGPFDTQSAITRNSSLGLGITKPIKISKKQTSNAL